LPTTTDRIIAANRTQQHGKRRLAMYNASILPNSSLLLADSRQKTLEAHEI
jgi:hypothetical protein